MRRPTAVTLLIAGMIGLSACSATGSIATMPPITPTQSPAMSALNQASARWQARNIPNYRLTVVTEWAFSIVIRHTLTIREGTIVERTTSCGSSVSASCGDATAYTIPYLFGKAGTLIAAGSAPITSGTQPAACTPSISYDAEYGFPRYIACDAPGVYDDQYIIRVVEFVPLPAQ